MREREKERERACEGEEIRDKREKKIFLATVHLLR